MALILRGQVVILFSLLAVSASARTRAGRATRKASPAGITSQLMVNKAPFHMKGICWNPVGKGGWHQGSADFLGFAESDAKIMQEAGINVVRFYVPITDVKVLDTFLSHGIYVVNTAYSWGGATVQSAVDVVTAVNDHPAVIMWTVGNEWNYNTLYHPMSFHDARHTVAAVVKAVKEVTTVPVSTVYGELPDAETLKILDHVDVWGINAYRSNSFGDLFTQWKSRSNKPMYLGEYGADAWDARFNTTNYEAQADATTILTNLIVDESSVTGGVCMGGFLFEFADEWWKNYKGDPMVHDVGGISPGGGPWPDLTFNEEWWGIVDIDRKPRPAFEAFKKTPNPMYRTP